MTDLTKPVKRKTRIESRGRRIVVTLFPGDVIGFRESGCRTEFQTTLEACYHMAIKQEILSKARAKKAARKGKEG